MKNSALAFLSFALVGIALADEPKKAPDWSAFVVGNTYVGEVKDAKGDLLTIVVKTPVTRNGKTTMKNQDTKLTFAENGYVRWKNLPPKLDDKGKKLSYTAKEMEAFRQPANTPGYAASREDLVQGQFVEVIMIRPKEITAEKAVFQDYKIKQVMITGMNPALKPVEGKKLPE